VNVLLGSVVLFGGNYAPAGWALCDGQTLDISGNQALFSVVGTWYGGDGVTNFALPNLAPVSENGPWYIISMDGVYPSRD
jgi:microcystin-dependent protein